MRNLLLCLMAMIFVGGCLSPEDRDFFIQQGEFLQKRIAEYEVLLDETEATITDLKAKIESKEIDVATGLALINDAKEQYAGYKRMIKEDQNKAAEIDDRLRDKGSGEKWEALAWTLVSIAGALAGVRVTRGPSSRVHKNPDGSMKPAG